MCTSAAVKASGTPAIEACCGGVKVALEKKIGAIFSSFKSAKYEGAH